ncbi:Na+/H+ antiporter NhaC family protein [Actinopolyspora mortivallis]|uniref:Sodium:proton antiporter n=1 Tax=Actinopolyspora mortivallis TaxID=33906 RepID=A0A2T0GT21_ACTMO|nr:Na+/H+ antiporter NhaC family protein [Actinopolyspora mortivallis]PRW62266.1 sodium:proton antiporter [Actinopolyspora mortivallis]
MSDSFLSLVPPVLALGLVVLTRKVLLSLSIGILSGVALLNGFAPLDSLGTLFGIVAEIFVSDGGINTGNVFILCFLLLLGMTASVISACGGSHSFAEWATRRFRTRRGTLFFPTLLGVVLFIDDYFNALVVGNVSRPVTDRQRISRAKLAYTVDSTSAPICILMPISSWGAYIISVFAGIVSVRGFAEIGGLEAFLRTVPVNYYAVIALLMVLCVVFFGLDIGPMRRHEQRALRGEGLTDPAKGAFSREPESEDHNPNGRIRDLIVPILALVVATVVAMIATGARAAAEVSPLAVFENTDVPTSLLCGGVVGWLVALGFAVRAGTGRQRLGRGTWSGIRSMLPAIWILLFAWTIIAVIERLGTGEYLAGLVSGRIDNALIPLLIFVTAGFMSLSTGTSWGTFGVMLPIAADIAAATDPGLMFAALGAVLAGAIWGDHCSPISDTTIMSSAGAQSHHIDHVVTQLPYALIIAGISAAGYLVLGLTGSGLLGLLGALVLFVATVVVLRLVTGAARRTGEPVLR